ncbi:MAG: ATP-binding protein [Pirellulales bacterium]|nr:ATP-binding protein [Pirellulales bacterium]
MASSNSNAERTLRASLPSNLTDYHAFIQTTLDHLAQLGWGKCELFGIHMALEESISNAIRHGNKEDPAKRVQVECRLSPSRFWISVCDEGAGFQPESVPDCCAADRLEVIGGRGLALMQAYMTRLQYNDRGNCLVMEKVLAGPSPNGACCCE